MLPDKFRQIVQKNVRPSVIASIIGTLSGVVSAVLFNERDRFKFRNHSKKSITTSSFKTDEDRVIVERASVATEYGFSYLLKTMDKISRERMHGENRPEPVFHFGKLDVALPSQIINHLNIANGFTYVGQRNDIFFAPAAKALENQQFVQCYRLPLRRHDQCSVELSGTESEDACSLFKDQLMRELIGAFARRDPLVDDNMEYSVTSVFHLDGQRAKKVGELADVHRFPEVANLLNEGNYVRCPYYSMRKTRLSYGAYADIDAVVAGTTDENICENVYRKTMMEILKQY